MRYTFKWQDPSAKEVYVTGTFDNWSKSVKLLGDGDTGCLSNTFEFNNYFDKNDKIVYKFVVDGNWTIDPESRKEVDVHSGIENNVLLIEDLLGYHTIQNNHHPKDGDMGNSHSGISNNSYTNVFEDGSSEFTSISVPSRDDQEVFVNSVISNDDEYQNLNMEAEENQKNNIQKQTNFNSIQQSKDGAGMTDSIQITLRGVDSQSLISNNSNNNSLTDNISSKPNNNSGNLSSPNNRSSNNLRNPTLFYKLRSFLKG